MTDSEKLQAFDFRTPGSLADHVENQLAAWQRRLCEYVAERWNQYCQTKCEWATPTLRTLRQSEALAKLPEASTGFVIALGRAKEETLFVFSRQTLLALIMNILGDSVGEDDSRELSDLENSLSELLLQELASGISEASTGAEPIRCAVKDTVRLPQRTRMFASEENLVVCQFELSGPLKGQACFWLLRQSFLKELFAHDKVEISNQTQAESRDKLKERSMDVPFNLVIRLGKAKLKFSELARLKQGDIVVLDKLIRDPLDACVAGIVKFRGRAGRTGHRQAFQVEEVIEK